MGAVVVVGAVVGVVGYRGVGVGVVVGGWVGWWWWVGGVGGGVVGVVGVSGQARGHSMLG